MNKYLKFLLVFIVIIIVVGIVIFFNSNKLKNNTENNDIIKENFQESVSSEKNDENKNIKYIPLEQLPVDYNIEQAVADKCFVITDALYNEDVLDEFLLKINNGQDSNLRIIEITSAGNITILDLVYSGDMLICSEDYSRNDGTEIIVNEYDLKNEYILKAKSEFLEDSTEMLVYFLENKNNTEENILLFGYKKNNLNEADYLPNKFDAVVKSVDQNFMIIEPLESTAERNVSNEIYVTLEEGLFESVAYEVGQSITVTYTGEITEIADMYQIEILLSIE